jgi:orotate phosphoribosyltransferase
VLVAHDMGLPFLYVRSDAKDHGLKNQVEGDLTVGRSVVVVEDLVSTGRSSLNAVRALRDQGCEVKGMVCIFTYGFDEAAKAFAKEKVKLHALTNYSLLLDQALRSGYIHEKDLLPLNEWRKDPAAWGVASKV